MSEDCDDYMIYCDKCDMCGNTTHISSYTQYQNTENNQYVVACLSLCYLPFGLATACYVHLQSYYNHAVLKHWYSQGLRAIIYSDNSMVAVQGKDAVDGASKRVINDLGGAGLVENTEKSNWVSVQCLTWLVFIMHLEKKGKVEVLKEKLEAFKVLLRLAIVQQNLYHL